VFKQPAERNFAMPDCTQEELSFPSFDRRKIEASFTGGDVSSDGGVMLLREADRRLGLTKALDSVLVDPRDPNGIAWQAGLELRRRQSRDYVLGLYQRRKEDSSGAVLQGSMREMLTLSKKWPIRKFALQSPHDFPGAY
jgi:hypothetical protein